MSVAWVKMSVHVVSVLKMYSQPWSRAHGALVMPHSTWVAAARQGPCDRYTSLSPRHTFYKHNCSCKVQFLACRPSYCKRTDCHI